MTTEIDAEGLVKARAAYRIVANYPIVPANHDDALENAIRSYLATTRTSEAELVADPSFANALRDSEVRIWINTCNHEPARQALRQLLAYRVRGVSQPLRPTPASDDQVEAVTDEGVLKAAIAIKRVFYERMDLGPEGDKELTLLDAAHLARAALLAAMGSTKR